jgi:8-amino-7-oxononanoate synthase
MYPAPDALLRRWLAERLDSGLLRRLRCTSPVTSSACFTQEGRQRISFASNDYLGLSHHPVLVEALREGAAIWGVGAGSSALVGGYTEAHAALEADLASSRLGTPPIWR